MYEKFPDRALTHSFDHRLLRVSDPLLLVPASEGLITEFLYK
jgi:hypothetical protein